MDEVFYGDQSSRLVKSILIENYDIEKDLTSQEEDVRMLVNSYAPSKENEKDYISNNLNY